MSMGESAPVIFAACALLAATISPVLVSLFTRRVTVRDRAEQNRRQDAVAAQAAKAAELLRRRQDDIEMAATLAAKLLSEKQDEIAAQAARAAQLLVESNTRVAAETKRVGDETRASLKSIHTLVNSNLTEAQQLQLEATRGLLKALRQVVRMKEDRGERVTADELLELSSLEERIVRLARDLEFKEKATRVADSQLSDQLDTGPPVT